MAACAHGDLDVDVYIKQALSETKKG